MISELIARFRRRSSTTNAKTGEQLNRDLIPWLMATASASFLPHFSTLPSWLWIGASVALGWRWWLWQQGQLDEKKWRLVLASGLGAFGVIAEYRTIFGQDAGVALLVVLMSLKLLEIRGRRDAVVIVMLGYFLLLTHYFYTENIPAGIWMLIAMIIATATLIRLQAAPSESSYETIKRATTLVAQALPIMVVLFVLFPRISGPLWGLPQNIGKPKTGLSEEMSPGSISELSLSPELAFRAEFKHQTPARELLYWRGPVLSDFDGRTWKIARSGVGLAPRIYATHEQATHSALTEYAITLEPHQQRWLLALDVPVKYPSDSLLTSSLSVISRTPVRDRKRLEFTSLTSYRAGLEESPENLNRYLALPRDSNPLSRQLAAKWRAQSDNPGTIAKSALHHFRDEDFVYTLNPPRLGQDSVDEFLFSTKRGFCEHYASAFVFLMRSAGIPSRVVTGYLGGETNPIDGHLAIRQADAHAWAEIWTPADGWKRVDPTATIAPNRVVQGLQASLPADETLPATLQPQLDWLRALRYRWDAIDYAWSRWMLGYDAERQRQLLRSFGLSGDWKIQIAVLVGLMGGMFLGLMIWVTRRRPPRDRAQALWLLACESFSKQGVPRARDEGPSDYAKRVANQSPALADPAKKISGYYIHLRYATAPGKEPDKLAKLTALQREVGKLVPRWKLWSLRL